MTASCNAFLAALGLALAGCATPPPVPTGGSEAEMDISLANTGAVANPLAMRDLLSIYRHNHGLPPLTIDPALQAAALEKARAMARADKASGGVNVPGRAVVSNVAAGYHTVADAFSGWRGGTRQNANMLKPGVKRMGVASVYAPGSKYGVFWALVLAD